MFNFNTDPKTMGESINIFLDGMKSAFYTSIIGMIAGLVIKYIQSGTKQRSDSAIMTHLSQISSVREAVSEVKSANHDDSQRIVDTLQALQKSVEAGSTANLSKELSEMSQRMSEFINSVNASQSDMRQLIKSFAGFQSQMSKDITGISASIQSMSDNQSKQISSMKDTLSEQLSSMGASFTAMQAHSAQSAEAMSSMLSETRKYQEQSLANDKEQADILTRNTEVIDSMRSSFDQMVANISETFGEEVIKALNNSIDKMNDQLETQFGENFKHLNRAVEALLTWQENYKATVEKSITELNAMNEGFQSFHSIIENELNPKLATIDNNIKSFIATSEANVAIQENLTNATADLAKMVETAHENVASMQAVADKFGGFTDDVVSEINTSMEKLVGEFDGHMKNLNETALTTITDTNHYLRDFQTVSKDTMQGVREALEMFRDDFKTGTDEELTQLREVFKQMAKNTDKQQDKAIKSLAGTMGAITEQIIGNYNALISRIAELDTLIKKNGGR
ncbi:MAG: hypothetical protein SO022_06525 [Selenomonadaceae bacterium]|nr:hypothetical protein [Selenomonadaceae bacterium]